MSNVASLRVYLAGNWLRPPRDTANVVVAGASRRGVAIEIVGQWWDRDDNLEQQHNATLEGQLELADRYDVFVLCMSAIDGAHHFAGSHLGAGMALHAGKTVIVFGDTKPYTSLLMPMWCTSIEALLDRLAKIAAKVKNNGS